MGTIWRNFRDNSLARRNYIASNLQISQVEICFCALRNTPLDLAKVYYLESFAIYCLLCYMLYSFVWSYDGYTSVKNSCRAQLS